MNDRTEPEIEVTQEEIENEIISQEETNLEEVAPAKSLQQRAIEKCIKTKNKTGKDLKYQKQG